MTRAEKAGYKAYPENVGYSTIGDTMYDYNAEKRRVFVEGYKDAVRKVYDWIISRYENQGAILLEDINELKQVLEE